MIVTLTPNPSVDRTVEVDALVRGQVLRASGARLDAGGKGVNVSRALQAHGVPTRAVVPVGGLIGRQLVALLAASGTDVIAVPVAGEVRANVSVVEPDGTVTKVNEPGPVLSAAEVDALVEATVEAADGADWVVLCGSLPPGCPDDLYARLVGRITARVAVDTSGAPLRAALAARPAVVKPNRDELHAVTGFLLRTVGDVVLAARALSADAVLASLGPDGAVLVEGDNAWYGEATVDSPVSAVGAGDAALAGFLAAGGRGPLALAEALAYGAAAVRQPGSRVPRPGDLDRSAVRIAAEVPMERDLKGGTA